MGKEREERDLQEPDNGFVQLKVEGEGCNGSKWWPNDRSCSTLALSSSHALREMLRTACWRLKEKERHALLYWGCVSSETHPQTRNNSQDHLNFGGD
ncbi:hypothetical protein GBA52_028817 [Prunus armeniaca]|nr:hypothetical protein GBA52_028817 [Prunus armeniaca]